MSSEETFSRRTREPIGRTYRPICSGHSPLDTRSPPIPRPSSLLGPSPLRVPMTVFGTPSPGPPVRIALFKNTSFQGCSGLILIL